MKLDVREKGAPSPDSLILIGAVVENTLGCCFIYIYNT